MLLFFFFFSLRVGVIPEPLLFLKRGNSKSDNSLKKLRIELKSIEVSHFYCKNIKTSAEMSINVFPIQTFVNSNKPV